MGNCQFKSENEQDSIKSKCSANIHISIHPLSSPTCSSISTRLINTTKPHPIMLLDSSVHRLTCAQSTWVVEKFQKTTCQIILMPCWKKSTLKTIENGTDEDLEGDRWAWQGDGGLIDETIINFFVQKSARATSSSSMWSAEVDLEKYGRSNKRKPRHYTLWKRCLKQESLPSAPSTPSWTRRSFSVNSITRKSSKMSSPVKWLFQYFFNQFFEAVIGSLSRLILISIFMFWFGF